MAKRNKNVSKTIPNGRTLQTRDEFLETGKGYKKPGYEKKGFYRKVIVIDSNRKNELVVVKGSTKGKEISGEAKTRFKPFVVTLDCNDKPIKVGGKFIENKSKKDFTKQQVNQIKKEVYMKASKRLKKENIKKTRKVKGRK